MIDLQGDPPSLQPKQHVIRALRDPDARARAITLASMAFHDEIDALFDEPGGANEYIRAHMNGIERHFERAIARWVGMYRAADNQAKRQHVMANDASKGRKERDTAQRLYNQALRMKRLLEEPVNAIQGEFYTYRYLASEGFLPGYSFPRLPLSAYIPGHRGPNSDDFLSRPRFLAVSEFGPGAIIYHEGATYQVNRVTLPMREDGEALPTERVAICASCGHLHHGESTTPDRCDHCGELLGVGAEMDNLLEMKTVHTRRRDRISSNEEERKRRGFEVLTRYSFNEEGLAGKRKRLDVHHENFGMELTFAKSADLWRINVGLRRRANPSKRGYVLNTTKQTWSTETLRDNAEAEAETSAQEGDVFHTVIPYVRDRRDILLLTPKWVAERSQMLSLAAAVRRGLVRMNHLEDREMMVELLPNDREPRTILLYEAAEGGTGALWNLVSDAHAFPRLVNEMRELVHLDEDGRDMGQAHVPACVEACYDCLLSYTNQPHHEHIRRTSLRQPLMAWSYADVRSDSNPGPAGQLQDLLAKTESDLERRWLNTLFDMDCLLPDDAQHPVVGVGARLDFAYLEHMVAVHVDGPNHDEGARRSRDVEQRAALEAAGWQNLVFHHSEVDDWPNKFIEYAWLFGAKEGHS